MSDYWFPQNLTLTCKRNSENTVKAAYVRTVNSFASDPFEIWPAKSGGLMWTKANNAGGIRDWTLIGQNWGGHETYSRYTSDTVLIFAKEVKLTYSDLWMKRNCPKSGQTSFRGTVRRRCCTRCFEKAAFVLIFAA